MRLTVFWGWVLSAGITAVCPPHPLLVCFKLNPTQLLVNKNASVSLQVEELEQSLQASEERLRQSSHLVAAQEAQIQQLVSADHTSHPCRSLQWCLSWTSVALLVTTVIEDLLEGQAVTQDGK